MKTTMLVASLSGQRCQTIHALDVNNMVLTKDHCTFYIQELLKTLRPGKHFGKLELRAYHPDKRLYVLLPFLKNMLDAPNLCGAVPVCLLATKSHMILPLPTPLADGSGKSSRTLG